MSLLRPVAGIVADRFLLRTVMVAADLFPAALAVYSDNVAVAYGVAFGLSVGALRGRAFALYDVLWNTARLLSLRLGALRADAVGVRARCTCSADCCCSPPAQPAGRKSDAPAARW